MRDPHVQSREILVVGSEEAFYELIQNVSPDLFKLTFAAEASEADRRVSETLPDLIVLEARAIRQEIPSYLAKARGKGVAVLAVLTRSEVTDVDDDDIPMSLFDRLASLTDRAALIVAVRELLQERRQKPRVNATLDVEIDDGHAGKILDLSASHLRLRTEVPLAPKQVVALSFEWGRQTISTRGTVLSISDQEPDVAVLSLDDDDGAVELLDRMVRKVLEVEHYRSAADDGTEASQGPVAWQLARRAERALRQTGSFKRVSTRESRTGAAVTGLSARYDIGRRLGRWGSGDVYEAEEHLSGRPVLLKILLEKLRNDGPARARLEMEARSATDLREIEGVVGVLDFGGDGEGGLYYALEALDGQSLATLLASGQAFSERETARLGAHLADTLARARELGHGHHDICPENVFMLRGPGGTWLPRLLGFAGELPSAGALEIHARGADYWPPEVTECPADEAGDTFALCGLLRDVLSSTSSRSATPPAAETARHKLHRLLWFGTADQPGDRFQHLQELSEALVQCSESLDLSILGPPASIPAPGARLPEELPEPAEADETAEPGTPRQRQDTLQPAELIGRRRKRRQRSWGRLASGVGIAAAAGIAAVLFFVEPWRSVVPRGITQSIRAVATASKGANPASVSPAEPDPLAGLEVVLAARGPYTDRPRKHPPAESADPRGQADHPQRLPVAELAPDAPAATRRLTGSQRRRYYLRRAQWYLDHSDARAAQRNLARALRYGDSHRLRKLMSRAAAESGHSREAIRHLQRAARLAPHSWRYRLQLGRLLIEVGRTSEACRAFLAAFARKPDHAAIRSHHRRFCGVLRRARL